MCDGDVEAAIKLAVGRPVVPGVDGPPPRREEPDWSPSQAELDEIGKAETAREKRVNESPAMTIAWAVSMLAFEWLKANEGALAKSPIPAVTRSIEVMGWDAAFIAGKVNRALIGRDEAAHGEGLDDDPVQTDWNGSAKVTLISIERSIVAWRTVADATDDADARCISNELQALQALVTNGARNASCA